MSLGIVIKGPEGLVLAAESRVTLAATSADQQIHVNFDNATKLLSFSKPHNYVGAVTYGQAAINLRTAHSFLPEFEAKLPDERLSVEKFAERLSIFFMDQWQGVMPEDYPGPNMSFVVGGFDKGEPYGRVFLFEIPGKPVPNERNPDPGFGITWGGQREIVDRLIRGYDHRMVQIVAQALNLEQEQAQLLVQAIKPLEMPMPLQAMALQDCVDLAIFFIRTTITAQTLTVGVRGCGGPIDVGTITRRDNFKYVQRKVVVGEKGITPDREHFE